MAELTLNEKRLLAVLAKEKKADAEHLASLLNATPEAVVQWAHLAEDKGLAKVERLVKKTPSLTEEGVKYRKSQQLPETQILNEIKTGTTLADLQEKKKDAFKIGFGQLRKKGLVKVEGISVIKMPNASTEKENNVLLLFDETGKLHVEPSLVFGEDYPKDDIKEFVKRGIAQEFETVRYSLSITPTGIALVKQGLDLREEIGTLTRDQILSGAWKTANLRRYDIKKLPKTIYPGKSHPYQRLIDEMRQILLEMGFTEMHGGIVQSAFWNFDALFQPQDHPAREMQDTFYLDEELPLPGGLGVPPRHARAWRGDLIDWLGREVEPRKSKTVRAPHPHDEPLYPVPRQPS